MTAVVIHTKGAVRRLCTVAVVGAWVAAFACSSTYDGPRSTECSSGPPYDVRNYPPAEKPSSNARDLPECVPRCGAEQKYSSPTLGTLYSLAALPSGACANDDERCAMAAAVVSTCRGETRPCDRSGFECVCTGGTWRCYATSQGAGTCVPCDLDASAE